MTPSWYKREIGLGDYGPDVNVVRRKLGLGPGQFDEVAFQRVRGLAQRSGLSQLGSSSGEVTAPVAEILGEAAAVAAGLAPEWFTREITRGDSGEDVRHLRSILGLPDGDTYDHEVEAAVRRFESGLGRTPTGVVDEDLSKALGEAW